MKANDPDAAVVKNTWEFFTGKYRRWCNKAVRNIMKCNTKKRNKSGYGCIGLYEKYKIWINTTKKRY